MATSVARNTLHLTVAHTAQKVLAFAYFLFLARVMMPEGTGAYFLTTSLTTIFIVIGNFGIAPVLIREIAKTPDRAEELLRRALGVKFPLILAAIAALNVAVRLLGYDELLRELVVIASFVLVADAFSVLFYGVLRGFQELRYESVGVFTGQLISVLWGTGVLILAPSLHLLVVGLLLGSAFNMVFAGIHAARRLGVSALRPAWDGKRTWQFLCLAFPFALATVFVKVYSYVDSIFLSLYLGTAAVGIYSVAYKFTYAFQFIPLSFVAALYPNLSALVARDKERLADAFTRAMWYMALLAAPISFGIWSIAPDLVSLAGEGYDAAAPVLQALVLVLIPIFLDFPIGSLLNAADRQTTKTAIMGVTMVINLVMNALLIPVIGIMGAAYAALASFSFMLIAGLWFVPRIIPGYGMAALAAKVMPILASGVVMAAVSWILLPAVGFVAVIPVAAVAYAIMLLATGSVTREDLRQMLRLFRRSPYEAATPAPHD